MTLTKPEQIYTTKCRLSLENYLEMEKRFFEFADTIYIWDQWGKKKDLSTLALANLLTNICIGFEESLKLLLCHPMNNRKEDFSKYFKTIPAKEISRKNDKLKEIENEDYRNISLIQILDFQKFRDSLNNASDQIVYVRPPLSITFNKGLFGKEKSKPIWFKAYEEVKHNIFSSYTKTSISLVLEALASYYLVAKIIAHEGSAFELPKSRDSYFPWSEGKINIDTGVRFSTSKNWLSHFKSDHFINISVKKS